MESGYNKPTSLMSSFFKAVKLSSVWKGKNKKRLTSVPLLTDLDQTQDFRASFAKIYCQSKAAANPAELTHQWFRQQDLLECSVAPAHTTTCLCAPGKAEHKARTLNSVQGSPQYC